MGKPKTALDVQRKAKIAALKEPKLAFEEHMALKRQLRQLFKLETPRRRRWMPKPQVTVGRAQGK